MRDKAFAHRARLSAVPSGGFIEVLKDSGSGQGAVPEYMPLSLLESALEATPATGAGTGITGGTGTVYTATTVREGNTIRTQIFIDLTGLDSVATEGDIIGVDGTSNPCHLGAIAASESGALYAGKMTCIETPAGGEVDIDLYAADEGTGVTDGAIGDLVETQLVASAADWAALATKDMTAVPGDGQYLYLTVGTSSTPTADTYTAGQFLIELWGYATT
jgi:hypothetical protein